MRGIVRPCRTHLGPDLHARWQAHLCGLCLTLRDVAGQAERVLTGYDVLLLSVLVEAQAGHVETSTAAPCPLRGFTGATVVASTSVAGQLAAAGALLSAGAGLTDKAGDGDLPSVTRPAARRVAARLARTGTAVAARVGLDPTAVLAAPARAAAVEARAGATLDDLLAPTGSAVASLFGSTAAAAGRPANRAPLERAGDAFGRLVHLLDAVEDLESDAAAGAFNPLRATGTDAAAARALADRLVRTVSEAVAEADLVDRELVEVLLGRELEKAVGRVLPVPCAHTAVPEQRTGGTGAWAATVAAMTLLAPAVFVGGSFGGGGCGGRRRRRYSDPGGYPAGWGGYPEGAPYGRRRRRVEPGYGYRRVGPSCGEMLACNCCANLACNACCCGNECANG